ncbi:TRAP transporter small permease [Halalkalibacter krulwichiae]|uniref:Tripartite ATP-independent periplasmic transporters, DctQ component n=1 Tax=Halalkalibacter krulwichiae TaxID=199441 RepID=A0A1X9MI76_9BACI|nr:TRAP transporter small permease [Halalkalibacter krulwichiae]ARK32434.1 Tripartite ATP-independent periplasmic transporters, DctQ component [Halalkalibacter krulwichiae]
MNENQFNPIISNVIKVGMYISGIAILIMMVMTVIDVTLKALFSSTIPGNYLYVQNYLMPVAFFCGLPYVFFTGIFPRLDLLIKRFSKKVSINIMISVLVIELLVYILITYYSFSYGLYGLRENITFLAGVNSLPLYPMFFLVTIGFAMLTICLILTLRKMIKTNGEFTFFNNTEET